MGLEASSIYGIQRNILLCSGAYPNFAYHNGSQLIDRVINHCGKEPHLSEVNIAAAVSQSVNGLSQKGSEGRWRLANKANGIAHAMCHRRDTVVHA